MKRLRLETLQSEVTAANLFDIGVNSPEDIARSIVEETIRIGKSTKAQLISSARVREIAAMKKRDSGSKAGLRK
jgi:hypothetical protein